LEPRDAGTLDRVGGSRARTDLARLGFAVDRALSIARRRDDEEARYRGTIAYFRWGVLAVIVGVVLSIVVESA
jgi:hypothetical protein